MLASYCFNVYICTVFGDFNRTFMELKENNNSVDN